MNNVIIVKNIIKFKPTLTKYNRLKQFNSWLIKYFNLPIKRSRTQGQEKYWVSNLKINKIKSISRNCSKIHECLNCCHLNLFITFTLINYYLVLYFNIRVLLHHDRHSHFGAVYHRLHVCLVKIKRRFAANAALMGVIGRWA